MPEGASYGQEATMPEARTARQVLSCEQATMPEGASYGQEATQARKVLL
jgi:hypothetical protein